MASSRMPRLMAWVASVWRSRWGCTPGTPAARPTRATMRPMRYRSSGPRWSAIRRLCQRMCSRLAAVQAASSPVQLGVQRDVAVVAELAQRDPQPVPGADPHDRVGVQVGQLAGPHAGTGQQLDDQPVAGVGAGPGGGHQPGGVAVIEELGQRLGLFGDVPGDDRVAGWRVGPVPLDDPLEERPDGADPLPVRLGRDHLAGGPGLDGEPDLVVLDVVAADRGDAVQPGVGDQPAGELAQGILRGVHAGRGEERGQALQVPLDRRRGLRRRGPDLRPLRRSGTAGRRPAGGRLTGRQRGHRTATVCTASISATAASSASINSAARRYSPASQSLARCR